MYELPSPILLDIFLCIWTTFCHLSPRKPMSEDDSRSSQWRCTGRSGRHGEREKRSRSLNGLTSRETVRSRIMDTMRHRNTTTMIELIKLNQCMRWKADVVSKPNKERYSEVTYGIKDMQVVIPPGGPWGIRLLWCTCQI